MVELPSSPVILGHSVAQKRTGGGTKTGSKRVAVTQFIAENAAYDAPPPSPDGSVDQLNTALAADNN